MGENDILKREFEGMNVLVTGGAGFIGSHITDRLIELKTHVRVIDDFSEGKEENLQHLMDKIELIRGDIRDLNLVKRITKDVKFVFHQAARRSVPKSVDDPLTYNDV